MYLFCGVLTQKSHPCLTLEGELHNLEDDNWSFHWPSSICSYALEVRLFEKNNKNTNSASLNDCKNKLEKNKKQNIKWLHTAGPE